MSSTFSLKDGAKWTRGRAFCRLASLTGGRSLPYVVRSFAVSRNRLPLAIWTTLDRPLLRVSDRPNKVGLTDVQCPHILLQVKWNHIGRFTMYVPILSAALAISPASPSAGSFATQSREAREPARRTRGGVLFQ